MYNLEQFLRKQLMAILEDVEMYSDFYEVNSEEYSNLLQSKIDKETEEYISGQKEKGIILIKNGTRTRQLLTFNELLKIKLQRFVNHKTKISLFKKFSRASKAFENFIRYCLFLNIPYRKIQALIFEMTRGQIISHSLLSKLSKTKEQYVDNFDAGKITNQIDYVFIDACYYKVFSWYNVETGELVDGKNIDESDKSNLIKKSCEMAVYVAIGINSDGYKELLGVKVDDVESKSTWLSFLKTLKERGLKDPKLFVTDDFNGIVNVINSVYPNADVQKCTIHKVRNAVNIASKNQKQKMKTELKYMFSAESKDDALKRFANFKKTFYNINKKSVEIIENSLDGILTYYDYPEAVRRLIYTNNFCESYFSALRSSVKQKGAFHNKSSLLRYVLCSSIHITRKWNSKKVI